MASAEYISTGEAARILNISRSTVSRRFDAGMLQGRMNPITGERQISRQSIQGLIKKHNLSVDIPGNEERHIILSTSDLAVAATIKKMAAADSRLHLSVTVQGSDALIACSKKVPHLLIIDDNLPDIRGSHVVRSLKKCEPMKRLKVLCCGKGADAAEAAKWGADATVNTDDGQVQESMLSAIYRLLSLPAEQPRDKAGHEHVRQWPRFPTNLAARLALFPKSRPRELKWGTATIKDISEGGAYLSDIIIDDGALPGEPFQMLLQTDNAPLENWQAQCQVVRKRSNGTISAGVQFDGISDKNRSKINRLQVA